MSDGVPSFTGALLALAGSLFFLTAAIGLLRLPDFYTRAHAPTKAATLGLLLCATGAALLHPTGSDILWLEKLLLMLFVVLTAPVSAQLLVRGAAARGIPQTPNTQGAPTAGSIELLEDNGVRDHRPPTKES
jgi:multicomponent K+:H+ antiporter subunit G